PVFFATAPYPSLSALALTLLTLTFGVRLLRAERPTPVLALPVALGFALVVATHQLTATMAVPAALLLAFTERDVPRPQRLWLAGSVVGGVVLAGLWPYYPVFGTVLSGTANRVAPSAHYVSSRLHEFYQLDKFRATLGFSALALMLMPYFFVRRRVMFAIVGACLMLALFVARIILPVPLGHRYVLLAVFNLQVVLVAGLLELVPRGPVQAKAWALPGARALAALGVVALLGAQAWLGVQSARTRLGPRAHARRADSQTVRLGRAIGRAAGNDAIVLGTALGSWVVPAFGPRVVVLLHENPLVADYRRRELDARVFFSDGTSNELRDAILSRYHVTHVLLSANSAPSVRRYVAARGAPQDLPGSSVLYALSAPRRS
ncbi:MAG TPA: hypothetical protein VGQ57_00780, partial [Polyangiaceae bacterium]|nr:hypothetical protein [Polyangiaceae bacterium]